MLDYEGESWSFLQPFTVGSVQADELNTALSGAATHPSSEGSWMMALLIGTSILVLILLMIILLLVRREKDRQIYPPAP